MFGLDHLLSPIRPDEFLGDYWGRRALLIPGHPGKFPGLFGWDDINHALGHGRLRHPEVMLVLDRQRQPPEALEQLDASLRRGATLILNSIQTLDPLVDRFSSALARDLNTGVNVNCYASWPARQGFDTHHDRHDVFVVHVEGRKAWQVFEPTRRWPVEQEPLVKQIPPPDLHPSLQCQLGPGDVLYIPRGHWHHAIAETPSVHLTVGPKPRTGVDVLVWLTQRLLETDETIRRDLPLPRAQALGGDRPEGEMTAAWSALREHLIERLCDERLLDAFLQHCMAQNPPRRTYQLPQLVVLDEQLTMETRFVIAPEQKALIRYEPETRTATVTLRGQVVRLEHVPERLLEAFFGARDTVSGGDILTACPELRAEDVRKLLRQMFEAGILLLAEPPPG